MEVCPWMTKTWVIAKGGKKTKQCENLLSLRLKDGGMPLDNENLGYCERGREVDRLIG